MIRILITLLTLSLGLPALGQDSFPGRTRIVACGDVVEITGGLSERQSLLEPLAEGASVWTRPASFAVIDVDPGIRLTMSPSTVIALESLNALPSIRLEQGRVRVLTDSWALRVRSSVSDFLVSEASGEAELELSEGRVILQVFSGGLTMENVNTKSVVFRAPGETATRVFRAGSIKRSRDGEQSSYPYGPNGYGWYPNVYVGYPGFPYEVPFATEPTEVRPGRGRRQ